MAAQDIATILPSTCTVTIPSLDSKIHDVISRWSDTGLSLPYAVVTPTSIFDITTTIGYASANGLKIVPVVGGHASSLPVTSKTIYLNLTSPEFKKIELNEEKGEVTFGGGILTGELIKYLAEKGWYTTTPNSDTVGMVGALLGGLSSVVNSIHGFGIDHVHSINIIPFSNSLAPEDAPILTLTHSSTGKEKALFNVLCGAGHGLGIVTSITLSAFRIDSLKMTENKIWSRKLMFPASAIETAANLYVGLLPPPPKLAPVLVFLRAPRTAPVPGAPMILLALSYLGATEEAEQAAKKSYEKEYVSKATMAITGASEWVDMNASSAPFNAHGGRKESYAAFCSSISSASVEKAFFAWEKYSEGEGRARSYTVYGAWDTAQPLKNAEGGRGGLFPARDRGLFVQCTPWYYDFDGKAEADRLGKEVVSATRERDRREERRDYAFANNLVIGGDLREIYSEEQIEEIKRVREVWDREALGWGPGDGW